jgi:hypothetical protein
LASRRTRGRQGENGILDRARVMVVYSYTLWHLRSSDGFRKANGDSPVRSHVRIMSRAFRRRDRNWPHLQGASVQLAGSVLAVPRSPPETQS